MASGSIKVRSGRLRLTFARNSTKAQKRGAGKLRLVRRETVGKGRY